MNSKAINESQLRLITIIISKNENVTHCSTLYSMVLLSVLLDALINQEVALCYNLKSQMQVFIYVLIVDSEVIRVFEHQLKIIIEIIILK